MGKRCKRRPCSKSAQQPDVRVDVSTDSISSDSELGLVDSAEESIRQFKQVKDYISEIYSEHKKDLELRKSKRLASKKPTEYIQPYNLVVNWNFQCRIRLEIQAIMQSALGDLLKDSIFMNLSDFIDYLKQFLKEFEGKKSLLRAIMLYEAYHTLLNSISQVGSIVSILINKFSFELSAKKLFYEKVACGYFELIEEVWKKDNSRYIDDIIKIKQELLVFEKGENLTVTHEHIAQSESTSEGESSADALHNLSIDELVKFLDTDKKRKKRKNKKGKKVKEKEKEKEKFEIDSDVEKEIDLQVQEFYFTLNQVEIKQVRQKPLVSAEFLEGLREKLKGLRMGTKG
jgi:hypothetical protein